MRGELIPFECGIYARMRFFYLKHKRPRELAKMLKSGILMRHLADVDIKAKKMISVFANQHRNLIPSASLQGAEALRKELEASIINTLIIRNSRIC